MALGRDRYGEHRPVRRPDLRCHWPQRFGCKQHWVHPPPKKYVAREEVEILKNRKSITEATTSPGETPVIAGGRGTIPYTHGEHNHSEGGFTISKSGVYAYHVW